jgi:excisionase family DNA binding protein
MSSKQPVENVVAEPKHTFSAKEAAVYLGVSERHLWTQTNARRIPHVRFGRRVLYPVKELDAWLEDRAARSVK